MKLKSFPSLTLRLFELDLTSVAQPTSPSESDLGPYSSLLKLFNVIVCKGGPRSVGLVSNPTQLTYRLS